MRRRDRRHLHQIPEVRKRREVCRQRRRTLGKLVEELPMTPIEGPLYEYACNEGNRAMEGMLAGAREDEKAKR